MGVNKCYFLWVIACSSMLALEVECAKFEAPICDETRREFEIKDWQMDSEAFGPYPYTFTAQWIESSLNPLRASLNVSVVLVVNLGKPYEAITDAVYNAVNEIDSCEADGHLNRLNIIWDPYEFGADVRIDVDYNQCVSGYYMYKIDDQRFEFKVSVIPEIYDRTVRLRTVTTTNETDFPQSVRLSGQISGAILGGIIGGGLGAIAGAAEGEKLVQAKFDDAIARFHDVLSKLDKTQEKELSFTALVNDYKPEFGRPFFSYLVADYNPERPEKENTVSVLLRIPLSFTVPNAQMCSVKKKLFDSFSSHTTTRGWYDIPDLWHLGPLR